MRFDRSLISRESRRKKVSEKDGRESKQATREREGEEDRKLTDVSSQLSRSQISNDPDTLLLVRSKTFSPLKLSG